MVWFIDNLFMYLNVLFIRFQANGTFHQQILTERFDIFTARVDLISDRFLIKAHLLSLRITEIDRRIRPHTRLYEIHL